MSAAPNRRARALALFDELLDAGPEKRAAALGALAGDDPDAAEFLARLLAADEGTGMPLRTGGAGIPHEDGESRPTWQAGQTIGSWTLSERLGAGGMGEVWAAERAGEGFAQRAALKLLPRELATGAAAARFRRERRILAALEHPGIARFIDGGVSPEGVPYLAMERVDGTPITAHLAARKAPIEERLACFAEACEAVAFAHRALVVHRDLKPSNVFVTAGGHVKLLDFGIAKLVDDEATDPAASDPSVTFHTRLEERVMTPAYAAPEQIRGESVTTATDVWALGVLLYEILAGEHPFVVPGERRAEVEQRVLDTDPGRPSARAARTATSDAAIATTARLLRGDLDAIVLTALEKDPARRYPSVDALRDDVRAYLAGRPVTARSPAFAYRARKFVRRHRVAVAAGAVAALGLAAGLGIALWQAREATRAGRRAEEVKSFLLRLFTVASPEESRGERVTARELLDEGARRVSELSTEPELQSELYETLARLYGEIGLGNDALRLAETGLATTTRTFGAHSTRAFEAHVRVAEAALAVDAMPEAKRESDAATALAADLAGGNAAVRVRARALAASVADKEGRPADAARIQRTVVAELAADPSRRREETAALAGYVAETGETAEAERLQRGILAEIVAERGELHPDTARAHKALGVILQRMSRSAEAIAELQHAVEIHRKVQGDAHPELASALHELALALWEAARYQEAATVVEEGLGVARRARGEHSFLFGNALNDHATVAFYLGRFDVAARDWQEVISTWSDLLGAEHPTTLTVRSNLSALYERQGRLAEAEPLARAVLETQRRNSVDTEWLGALNTLGMVLRQRGKGAEAVALHREALAITSRSEGPDGRKSSWARLLAGRALLAAGGNQAEAAREIDRAREAILREVDAEAPFASQFQTGTAELRLAQSRPAEALTAADHALAAKRKSGLPESDGRMAEVHLLRGEALLALGRRQEARGELTAAERTLRAAYPADHPLLRRAQASLARLGSG